MDAATISDLRGKLAENREWLKTEVANLREDTKATTYLEDETDAYDQHPADDASSLTGRQTDMSLLHNLEQELGAVESALRRIEEGTYGTCEVCGKPVGEARLKARPSSATCIECQTAIEKRQRVEATAEPTY